MTDEFELDFGDLVMTAEALSSPEQILLVGGPGSGKTHSAMTLTEVEGLYPVLYLDTEGSSVGVADKFDKSRITVLRIETHAQLKDAVEQLLTKKHKYKTVVIDTIDTAQERAINLLKKKYPNDGFAVWGDVATWLTGADGNGLMHRLKSADFLSVVVVHTREEKSNSGAVIEKPRLQGSSKDVLASIPDCVFYQSRTTKKDDAGKVYAESTVYTVGTKKFDQAKTRFDLPPVMQDATLATVLNTIRSN